jgi:hypothetical protein
MRKKRLCLRRLWMVVALASLSIAGGIGLDRIEPVGRRAGLIQFDAVSELGTDGNGGSLRDLWANNSRMDKGARMNCSARPLS